MDGKVISKEEVIKLAKLPSKEMLLTQLATVLLANIRNLAVVLDQVAKKEETAEQLSANVSTYVQNRLCHKGNLENLMAIARI